MRTARRTRSMPRSARLHGEVWNPPQARVGLSAWLRTLRGLTMTRSIFVLIRDLTGNVACPVTSRNWNFTVERFPDETRTTLPSQFVHLRLEFLDPFLGVKAGLRHPAGRYPLQYPRMRQRCADPKRRSRMTAKKFKENLCGPPSVAVVQSFRILHNHAFQLSYGVQPFELKCRFEAARQRVVIAVDDRCPRNHKLHANRIK
jgi:hypothetical protein